MGPSAGDRAPLPIVLLVLVAVLLQRKTLMLVVAVLLLQQMLMMLVLLTVLFAGVQTGMVQRMRLMNYSKSRFHGILCLV
jgi:hypothetical protein